MATSREAGSPDGELDRNDTSIAGTLFMFMKTHTMLMLAIIVTMAFLFRSIPAWTNAAWGNDIGVYYGLTNSFVKYGTIFNTYDGWGGSYNYFPVLYVIGGIVHMITGVSIVKSLTYTAPVFGALTSLFIYLIVVELLGNKRIALLAAAFLAFNPIHLYQTSHAAPLTIGHFFMLICIYSFLAFRRKKRFFIPLLISSGLLIMSHHLTTYMYIISIAGIIFTGNLFSEKREKRFYAELVYLSVFSAGAFSYWLLVASRYFNSFLKSGSTLLPKMAVLSFYIGVLLLFLFTDILKKRFAKISFPPYTGKHDSKIGIVTIVTIILIMLMGTYLITIPDTSAKINWKVILVSIPLICTIAFVIIGLVYTSGMKVKGVLGGWMGAILVSLTFAIVSQNRVLFPSRHFEYLMEPISIVAAIGAYMFYRNGLAFRRKVHSLLFREKRESRASRLLIRSPERFRNGCIALILAVLLSNGISSYPMRTSIGPFNEDFSDQFMASVDWLKENVDRNLTIATQHPYSQYIHSEGFLNVTYDDTGLNIWHCNNWTKCYHELNMTNETLLPRVEYLLVDDIMRYVGVQAAVGIIPEPIDDFLGAWEKFMVPPFERVYLNGTYEVYGTFLEGKEWQGDWAALFTVNWSYIEENRDMIKDED